MGWASIDDYPFLRDLRFPLTAEQLRPLDPRCERVQFRNDRWIPSPLPTEADFTRLAAFLRDYPDVGLRIYGDGGETANLEFLKHFPFLTRFECNLYLIDSVEGLRHLPRNLKVLSFGLAKKKFSLRFVERFPELEELYIEGEVKDFEAIGSLTQLQRLMIRSLTVPSLDPLRGLPGLWWLAIKLGGTRNLEALRKLPRLKYLELWRIRGLEDIEPISDSVGLQYLFLQDLARVRRIPSLEHLEHLRRLHIQNLRSLRDLSPVREARALEELIVWYAKALRRENFEVLRGHPSLRSLSVGTGSVRRDEEIAQMLGWAEFKGSKDDFEFR